MSVLRPPNTATPLHEQLSTSIEPLPDFVTSAMMSYRLYGPSSLTSLTGHHQAYRTDMPMQALPRSSRAAGVLGRTLATVTMTFQWAAPAQLHGSCCSRCFWTPSRRCAHAAPLGRAGSCPWTLAPLGRLGPLEQARVDPRMALAR